MNIHLRPNKTRNSFDGLKQMFGGRGRFRPSDLRKFGGKTAEKCILYPKLCIVIVKNAQNGDGLASDSP